MKKCVVLIDGQNLFYALQHLQLKERDINWTALFNFFLEANDELIRAYWFRPQKIQDGHYTAESIRSSIVYRNYNGCYEFYKNKEFAKISRGVLDRIESEAREVEKWLHEQRGRFNGIEYNYDQLCLENSDIEIIKKGLVKVNPFKKEYTGEKGVDIALAVKMIALSAEQKYVA